MEIIDCCFHTIPFLLCTANVSFDPLWCSFTHRARLRTHQPERAEVCQCPETFRYGGLPGVHGGLPFLFMVVSRCLIVIY